MGFFLFLFFLFLIMFFITKYVSSKEIPPSSSTSTSASVSASASALSAINIPQRKYDVFLSFRGEDTRHTFTGHLHEALHRNRIKAFIDNQLKRGDEISQSLLKAIEESTVSIIIFSERYASSGWCLDELVKILECKNMYGQIVIPIFYHVDPSHVRNQTGNFGHSFLKLEERFKGKLQKWKFALKEAANLSGFDSYVIRYEPDLIQKIVEEILKKLKDKFSSAFNKDLIGVESRIEEIESLLSHEPMGVYTLGIWGMGGIGKTTIARAFFKKIKNQFEGSYFIPNIREESEKIDGLTQLQKELFFTLLGDGNLNMSFYSFDFDFEIERLGRKKILIVFDDVTNFEQINFLIGSFDRFLPGSLIIVTTRDKHTLLNCGVKIIYEMEKLEDVDALELFSWHAFRQSRPDASYEKLSNEVMQYAQGVPLVLKVLGCFLYRRSETDWESKINKLKSIPPNDVQQVLKISYDGLDDEEKIIFLDIACFFNWEDIYLVEKFLDGCGLSSKIGISVLVDRSLVIISNNKIIMHDLLQEMGKEIIRQESVDYPEKRSRLWKHEDVCEVLTCNTGTPTIQGIYLNMDRVKEIRLNLGTFKQMRNLRFLKFCGKNKFNISTFGSEGYIFHKLRYLHWDGYPLKSLSSNIGVENLVFLELPNSNVEQLWDSVQNLVNLKKIDLNCSRRLKKLPNLSNSPNLEELILNDTAIEELHSSIFCLPRLESLELRNCISLKSLPSNLFNLKSLLYLDLQNCSNLKSLPEISSCNLIELYLDRTAIEELPSSIEFLSRLDTLNLRNCSRFNSLPSSLCKLKSLRSLDLAGCSNLNNLPSSLCKLKSLTSLDLAGCSNLNNLPSSLCKLKSLIILDLARCSNLNNLPSSLCKLKSLGVLDLTGCSNLQRLPEEIGNLDSLKALRAKGTGITEVPSSIVCLKNLDELYLERLRGHEQIGFILPLSVSLDGLHSLRNLTLADCGITKLPESLFKLSTLVSLVLDKNKFESIPKSIISLCKLQWLSLNHCARLQSLPNLPSSLQCIYAEHCSSLEALSGLSNFYTIGPYYPAFDFRNCLKLDQNELKSIVNRATTTLNSVSIESLSGCMGYTGSENPDLFKFQLIGSSRNLCSRQMYDSRSTMLNLFKFPMNRSSISLCSQQMCYPGSEIPEFFKFQNIGSSLTLEIPPGFQFSMKNIFAFCLIVSFEDHYESGQRYKLTCELKVKTKSSQRVHTAIIGCAKSDHVIVGYDRLYLSSYGCDLRESCYNNKAIFEFHLLDSYIDCDRTGMVKKCGIHFL